MLTSNTSDARGGKGVRQRSPPYGSRRSIQVSISRTTVFWKPREKTILDLVTLITPCFLTVMPIRPRVITFLPRRYRLNSIGDDPAPTSTVV